MFASLINAIRSLFGNRSTKVELVSNEEFLKMRSFVKAGGEVEYSEYKLTGDQRMALEAIIRDREYASWY